MPASAPSLISVRKVFFDQADSYKPLDRLFGRTPPAYSILRNISFSLAQGAQVTLYGHEGSGKSTLLRLLTGIIVPTQGTITVNGVLPQSVQHLADGYVSSELSFPHRESAHAVLQAYGDSHQISNLPAKIGEITQILGLQTVLHRPAELLSTTERIRLGLARVILSDAPLILLDDIADHVGVTFIRELLTTVLVGRTCIISTRHTATAEALNIPLLILHQGNLAHFGTQEEIANALACEQLLDVWVEGLRYDLLRQLKQQTGVSSVRLLPSSRFAGQRLRISLQSSRYLPSLYNALSQAPLLKIQELPTPLDDIITKL
jgi:sodium transport system ATP-binding protein